MPRSNPPLARLLTPLIIGLALASIHPANARSQTTPSSSILIAVPADQDAQEAIDGAPAHAVLLFNRNHTREITTTLVVNKPVTILGLSARLPAMLGRTPLVTITSSSVTFADFELHGNADTVAQADRAPLIAVHAGGFRVERGQFINSSKDGLMIDPLDAVDGISGGVVRNLVGRGVIRDVVSISGGSQGYKVRHVLVEDIRAYDSTLRGAVEVSDGSEHITVRKIYAERCVYAVDVQDHRNQNQVNRNIVIEDICAVDCRHAIRTANHAHGHANLTIRDVVAERCVQPVRISHTENVLLHGVRILCGEATDIPVSFKNCTGLTIRDVVIDSPRSSDTAVQIDDCPETLVDGLVLRGDSPSLNQALTYRLTQAGTYSGLSVRNVFAPRTSVTGILLTTTNKAASLNDCLIQGNLASVVDNIQGSGRIISDNLPAQNP